MNSLSTITIGSKINGMKFQIYRYHVRGEFEKSDLGTFKELNQAIKAGRNWKRPFRIYDRDMKKYILSSGC